MTKIKSCLLCKNYNTHPCECEHCEDWNNFRISESGKALREEIYSDGYEKGKNERLPRYVDIAPLDILNLSGRSEEFVEGVKWILEQLDKNEKPQDECANDYLITFKLSLDNSGYIRDLGGNVVGYYKKFPEVKKNDE